MVSVVVPETVLGALERRVSPPQKSDWGDSRLERTHTERRGVSVASVTVELAGRGELSSPAYEGGLRSHGAHVVTTLLVNTPVVRAETTCACRRRA